MKTEEEFIKLRHVLSLIGKRIIPCYLNEKNKKLFSQWEMNSCRQTALFVSFYLQKNFPDRSISLYEANFKDPYLGDAIHAFTFMKPSEDSMGLLVDVSRVSYPVLVERMSEMRNPGTILSNKMGYEIIMEDLVEVDYRLLFIEKEYFTNQSYMEFCADIISRFPVKYLPKDYQ